MVFEALGGDESAIPDFFPLESSWQFILFGLGTIQYARHPEGVLAYQAAKRAAKAERRAASQVLGDGQANLGSAACPIVVAPPGTSTRTEVGDVR